MQFSNRGIAWCLSLGLTLALAASAQAAISFDQNVTQAAGALYYGTYPTNDNGGFTVDREAGLGLELGLRAHTRFNPTDSDDSAAGIKSQGNGVYGSFAAGGFGSGNNRASWNFDYSINSNFNGSGGNLNSGLTYVLSIDYSPGPGTSFLQIDPLNGTLIQDNGFGTNAAYAGTGATSSFSSSNNIAQNSEQLNFFTGPLPFDPTANGVYTIRLEAFQLDQNRSPTILVGQTQIDVVVGTGVPEPASLTLWGLGALGCAVAGYRRKRVVA